MVNYNGAAVTSFVVVEVAGPSPTFHVMVTTSRDVAVWRTGPYSRVRSFADRASAFSAARRAFGAKACV